MFFLSLSGLHHRRQTQRSLSLLPGILHGTLSSSRIENYQSQSDHCGHAKTSTRFPYEFRSDSAAHPDRQRNGHFGKRKNRKAHHEERPRRSQFICTGEESSNTCIYILNFWKKYLDQQKEKVVYITFYATTIIQYLPNKMYNQ